MAYNIIIDFKSADVNGDGVNDNIYLVGNKKEDELVISDIRLVIRDGVTNNSYQITFDTNKGYDPELFIGKFTKENISQMLVSIESGNTGREGYYYIYSFKNNIQKKIFDFEDFNNEYKYDVTYKNNYIVTVINNNLKLRFDLDISNKDKGYLSKIYNSNGSLKVPLKGVVSPLVGLNPVSSSNVSFYNLNGYQRLIGYYNADTLGMIVTPLYWNETKFVLRDNPYLTTNGTIINFKKFDERRIVNE